MENTYTHEQHSFSSRKKTVFTFIAGVICFTVCFLVMEVVARFIRPKIDLYELTGRIPGPNPMADWALVDAFSAYRGKPGPYPGGKKVNRHGFISTPEIELKKQAGTLRIVFLGGSSTAGTGWNLVDTGTWPWMTIRRLQTKHAHRLFDFINGALGGYSSFESYGRLWSRLIHFSPDIVILNHGWNEMYYFGQSDSIIGWRTLEDGSWGFQKTTRPVPIYRPGPVDPLVRWSQLLTVMRLSLSTPNKGEIAPSPQKKLNKTYNRKGLEVWRTQLKLFRETCRTLGIKLFVVKQPTLITADLPLTERRRCRYDFHGFDHDAHVDAFAAIYEIIDDEIPGDSIIDLTSLSGNPAYFFDHIHPNPMGARAISRAVSDTLSSYLARLK